MTPTVSTFSAHRWPVGYLQNARFHCASLVGEVGYDWLISAAVMHVRCTQPDIVVATIVHAAAGSLAGSRPTSCHALIEAHASAIAISSPSIVLEHFWSRDVFDRHKAQCSPDSSAAIHSWKDARSAGSTSLYRVLRRRIGEDHPDDPDHIPA